MKFSYIALFALPYIAAASILPRAATATNGGVTTSGHRDYELCCKYVVYDDRHDDHDWHHDHDHHYDGGIGYGCFEYEDWCPFGRRYDCRRYYPFDAIATGCYRAHWDDKKTEKKAT